MCPVVQSAISSAAENQRPKVFVSSSAVGYYGASQTSSFTEDSPAGNDFLAEICKGRSCSQLANAVGGTTGAQGCYIPTHFCVM
jgi:NAD dependent epimerase/dehydratase family enzyme